MSDIDSIVADRNAKTALQVAEQTKAELSEKVSRLEVVVNSLTQKTSDLERKYNLLLTARFDGKSTVSG